LKLVQWSTTLSLAQGQRSALAEVELSCSAALTLLACFFGRHQAQKSAVHML
jgi:hypothetical protein